jgi:SAM-dependent methyltransferase
VTGSTAGYANEAPALLETYERIAPEVLHRPVWHLIPTAPSRVLDIGAGSGRDAAHFAAMGHRVVAVEPVDAMREGAMKLHPSPRIEWLADTLPSLSLVRARGEAFDAVLATAVWMHLDESERAEAMPATASLVAPGGVLILSLRRGPIPPGRRMFDVPAEETIALAGREGLTCLVNAVTGSVQARQPDVTWTRLAFRKT